MLVISDSIHIPDEEIEISAIRAQGPGGQQVNKVSTAIHLRFDITQSSLPEQCKAKIQSLSDYRISRDGVINIKAQRFRSQLRNKEDALLRLQLLIQKALQSNKIRKKTRVSQSAKAKRLDHKTKRGQTKSLRKKPDLKSDH